MPTTGLLKVNISEVKFSSSAKPDIESLISVIPIISKEKPMMIPPRFFLFSFLLNIRTNTLIIARTGAKADGFKRLIIKLSPFICVNDKIQPVTVVPMFAPIITPIARESCIIPELTKPTTITVTAEDD